MTTAESKKTNPRTQTPAQADGQDERAVQEERAASERAASARLFMVVAFLLIFIMAARTPLDSDLWWHMRAGEQTLSNGRPLLNDLYSFTRLGAPWINHSWLSQVGMALAYRWFGFLGLGALVAVL